MNLFKYCKPGRACVGVTTALLTAVSALAIATPAATADTNTCHVWGGGFIPFLSNYTTCDTARGLQTVAPPAPSGNTCHVGGGGFIPGLSDYTTCDTSRGLDAVWEGPNRSPDYVVYDSSQQIGQFGLGATLIRTRDGTLFVGVSGQASPEYLNVTLRGGLQLPVAAIGYVGSPRDYNPSDSEIDSFVSGVTANVTIGIGGGIRLTASPSVHEVGVEYVAGGVLGVSYGLGATIQVGQTLTRAITECCGRG